MANCQNSLTSPVNIVITDQNNKQNDNITTRRFLSRSDMIERNMPVNVNILDKKNITKYIIIGLEKY
jgi:hypothetical protein